jgi:hypothetical protein
LAVKDTHWPVTLTSSVDGFKDRKEEIFASEICEKAFARRELKFYTFAQFN